MKPIKIYYENGQLNFETWRNKNGVYHRLNGPAYREWYKNGHLKSEEWWLNGKYHQLNGPAFQEWHKNGQLFVEEWLVDNRLHRLNGPAYRKWYANGHLKYEEWWRNGIEYKKKEHPFNIFRKEHNLNTDYDNWPIDMKVLFEVIYK